VVKGKGFARRRGIPDLPRCACVDRVIPLPVCALARATPGLRQTVRVAAAALRCADNPTQRRKTMTDRARLTEADLRQFTGTEQWYRHGLNRAVLYTDGAKYVADQCGAYWLLDEIALAQRFEKRVTGEEFQVWKLTVNPDRSALLSCEDGNDNTVFSKTIEFTDFPMDSISLYFTDSVILLPSEY
jgi:hypothetical protein